MIEKSDTKPVPVCRVAGNHSIGVSCVSAAKSQICTTSRRILTIPNFCRRQSKRLTGDRVVPVKFSQFFAGEVDFTMTVAAAPEAVCQKAGVSTFAVQAQIRAKARST